MLCALSSRRTVARRVCVAHLSWKAANCCSTYLASTLPVDVFAHCCSFCSSPEQGLLIKAIISPLQVFCFPNWCSVVSSSCDFFFFPVSNKAASIWRLLLHLPLPLRCICAFFSFCNWKNLQPLLGSGSLWVISNAQWERFPPKET